LAKKHRKEKAEKTPTRHQISKWERQRRLSSIIIIVSAVFLVIVFGLVGYGYYSEQVMPYQKTVIKVNDKSFDMDYYIKMLDIYSKGQTSDILKGFVDITANAIQQSEIIREKASELYVSVTDDEVNKGIEQAKLPESNVTTDMVKTLLLTQKIIKQHCLPKQPSGVEQVEVQAMFLENKLMADERRQRLLRGDNFTDMAGLLSLDSVTQSKKGYLGWIPKGYEGYELGSLKDSVLKDVIFKLEPKVISDPIYDSSMEKPFGYWVLEVIEKDDTKGVHARGILLATKDEAEDVRARIAKGESFDALAKQYSQHGSKDKGGDLGWIVPGMEKGMLDRIVAALQPNTLSEVIRDESLKTKGGYWLIEVMNKQMDRPLDDNIRQQLTEQCLSEWLSGQMKNAKIEILLDQKQKDWAVERVLKNRSK